MRQFVVRGMVCLLVVLAGIWSCAVPTTELTMSSSTAPAMGTQGMVATAHPLASHAALEILREGGNAVDAAVAAAFAIGVVEPDGSGLGGGGGMVIYLADEEKTLYINYYQSGPARINETVYPSFTDSTAARSVLVPGTVAGLTRALELHGTLPLKRVIAPAIRLAEEGFPIDATLAQIILDHVSLIQQHPSTEAVFFRDSFPMAEGDTIRQPDLARTLRLIAEKGLSGFYGGAVAEAIAAEIARLGGGLSVDDMRLYRPDILEPVRGTYRGYEILSAPPPHSGACIIEALNMLEEENLHSTGFYWASADALHYMAETLRRVYADRTAFIADPRFEDVPLAPLLSKGYARERRADINRSSATPREYRKTKAGNPVPGKRGEVRSPGESVPHDRNLEETRQDAPPVGSKRHRYATPSPVSDGGNASGEGGGHTTHLCVVDSKGNAVSLTQTLGTFFGSGITVSGVLLNNARSNFSTTTTRNAAGPAKRPRSSIAPTIVLNDGKVYCVVGTPGATRIVATLVEVLVNLLEYRMPVVEANRAPRFLCMKFDDYLRLESRIGPEVRSELEKRGHTLQVYGDFDLFFGGAQIIVVDPETGILQGSADPRRGGLAVGF